MRSIRLFLMSVAVLSSFGQLPAQSSKKWEWTGTTPEAAASATAADEKTVFLLNVGKYNSTTTKNDEYWLARGGEWGTQAVIGNVPMALTVTSEQHGYVWDRYYAYRFATSVLMQGQASTGYLGFMPSANANNKLCYFLDRGVSHTQANDSWPECLMSKDASKNVYTIGVHTGSSTPSYYMVAGRNAESTDSETRTDCINGFASLSSVTDDTQKWMLVTLKELKEYFQQVDAAESNPALATFLLSNPDFGRDDSAVKDWKTGDNDAPLTMESVKNDDKKPDTPIRTIAEQQGYYVGNAFPCNDMDQKKYGHQWTASVKGNGKISQTVEPIREGWYSVRVNGISFNTVEGGVAKLFASVGGATASTSGKTPYAESALTTQSEIPASYTAAESLVNDGSHEASVLVYVPAATTSDGFQTIRLGIEVSGMGADTWTCVDNFQMYYLGKPAEENVVLLDEDRTDIAYINQQNDFVNQASNGEGRKKSNVYLRRSLNVGKWNSIVLPFAISRDVINSVFGSGTIVSEFKGAIDESHPTRIFFEEVSQMEGGKLYIIKPTNGQPANQSAVEASAKNSDGSAVVSFAEGSDYWTFVAANFGSDNAYEASVPGPEGNETFNSGKVQFYGTYVSDACSANGSGEKLIPAGSYVISGNNTENSVAGLWYYRTVETKTKGFRGWLQPVSEDAAREMSVVINGVEDNSSATTAISQLLNFERPEVSGRAGIYNLHGQRVGNGSSVDGLPRGVYIVNGRKCVVK